MKFKRFASESAMRQQIPMRQTMLSFGPHVLTAVLLLCCGPLGQAFCGAPSTGRVRGQQEQRSYALRNSSRWRLSQKLTTRNLTSTSDGSRSTSLVEMRIRTALGAKVDDIDPLEAGADVVDNEGNTMSESDSLEKGKTKNSVTTKKRNTVTAPKKARGRPRKVANSMHETALEETRQARVEALKNKPKPIVRRSNSRSARGANTLLDWATYSDLQEGCRAHLVVYHSGLEEDKVRASKLLTKVADAYGSRVNTNELYDESEDISDEERQESRLFEVWLEATEQILYHTKRMEFNTISDEDIERIVEDIGMWIADEAMITHNVYNDEMFERSGADFLMQMGQLKE